MINQILKHGISFDIGIAFLNLLMDYTDGTLTQNKNM